MAENVQIGVTETINVVDVNPTIVSQVVDISVTDNTDEVTLVIEPNLVQINITKGLNADDLVTSVNGSTGDITISKSTLGLGNVDNTSDANKPISSATQTALNAKADTSYVNTQLSGKQNTLGYTPYNATNPSGYISAVTQAMINEALGYTPYSASNPSNYISGITSLNVTNALGYTPYNASNPSGFISGITSLMVTNALGFTPYNASNPSNFISLASLSAGTGISYNNTTGQIASTITQYTNSDARGAISLTTDGTSGVATYNSTTGVLNIPSYTGGGGGGSGTVTSVALSAPTGFSVSGTPITTTGTLALAFAVGYSLPSDATQATWSAKQNALNGTGFVKISGTTISYDNSTYLTGITSGQVTTALGYTPYNASNPNGYISGITSSNVTTALGYTPLTAARSLTINGTAYDLTSDRVWNVGTITSVSALTLGTSGTDLSSTVAMGTSTPVITLNVPTASATNRGVLSSADWTTFNNKANALSGTLNTIAKFTSATGIGNSSITDTGSLVTIANPLTLSGSVTGVGNLSNYSVTASSGSAISKKITSTLVASANNDTLIGLDINPTFTNGSFTGVTNTALRFAGTGNNIVESLGDLFIRRNGLSGLQILSTNTYLRSASSTGYVNFGIASTEYARLHNSGNFTLQNGGTFTDNGYRLEVNGTTRFIGTTASDTAPLGSELAAVTGSGTNWTLAGTNLNVGGYTHTTGSVVPLTTTLAAVSGTYYQITYTITGRTAGSIDIAYGGTTTSGVTASGNTGPLASSTSALTITPTTDFNGKVVLSIKSIGNSSASSTFANSSGTTALEIRSSDILSNTFIGITSGRRNTTGTSNTFIGVNAGTNNTTGANNTFIGLNAGVVNTTGGANTFSGTSAGQSNTTGFSNTFIGQAAGYSNTTGSSNSFFGLLSGYSNTTGSNNQFIGNASSYFNTLGIENTSVGSAAGYNNTTGSSNIFFGRNAGRYISDGSTSNAITDNSIYIGYNTKALANNQTNQVVIGYNSTGLGSNTTVLGNSSTTLTALYGSVIIGATSINASAQLQVDSTTKGILFPRMTTTQKNAISSPASGLVVYDTTLGKLCVRGATAWETITSV